VAGYYVLARTGRERFVLWLTGCFRAVLGDLLAGIYVTQERSMGGPALWFAFYPHAQECQAGASPGVAAGMMGWTLLVWVLFLPGSSDVAQLPPYFVVLSGCLTVLFVAATMVQSAKVVLPLSKVVGLFYRASSASQRNYRLPRISIIFSGSRKVPHLFLRRDVLTGIIALDGDGLWRLRPSGSWCGWTRPD